jgi:hypothetical protein
MKPKILTLTSTALTCSTAAVKWTTNMPVTAVVGYGTQCRTLSHWTTAGPLATSDSTVISLSGTASARIKVMITTPAGARGQSDCYTASFLDPGPNLMADIVGEPTTGTLAGVGPVLKVKLVVRNTGCGSVTVPISAAGVRAGGSVAPVRAGYVSDTTRLLSTHGLASGDRLEVAVPFSFPLSQLGAAPGSRVRIGGQLRYGEGPSLQIVPFSFFVRAPY